MCERAGCSGRYTNHSRKVTCATELFALNVDEQLIYNATDGAPQLCCEGTQEAWCSTWYVGFCNPSTPKEVQVGWWAVCPSIGSYQILWGSVDPLFKRQIWNSPFQMGMEKLHIHSLKENYPSPHNLSVVLNFNFGWC